MPLEKVQMTLDELKAVIGEEGSEFRQQCEKHLTQIGNIFGSRPFTVKVQRNPQTGKIHYAFVQTVFGSLNLSGHTYPIRDGNVYSFITPSMSLNHLNQYTGIGFFINQNL